jgi:feruloyl esterase
MISRASLTLILLCVAAANCFAATCDSLRNLKLQDTTITAATEVAAGAFTPPDPQVAAVFKQLSAFCRVAADVKPTADSDIKMEVWLPLTGWNKRFVSNGNGGFAGSINPVAMARAVGQGFATASTDTGHESPDATDARWALGHPEKIVDFGWRGVHLMTVQAKAIDHLPNLPDWDEHTRLSMRSMETRPSIPTSRAARMADAKA